MAVIASILSLVLVNCMVEETQAKYLSAVKEAVCVYPFAVKASVRLISKKYRFIIVLF